jgi:hypothetical protein
LVPDVLIQGRDARRRIARLFGEPERDAELAPGEEYDGPVLFDPSTDERLPEGRLVRGTGAAAIVLDPDLAVAVAVLTAVVTLLVAGMAGAEGVEGFEGGDGSDGGDGGTGTVVVVTLTVGGFGAWTVGTVVVTRGTVMLGGGSGSEVTVETSGRGPAIPRPAKTPRPTSIASPATAFIRAKLLGWRFGYGVWARF